VQQKAVLTGDRRGTIARDAFGRIGAHDVCLYTMTNAEGCVVKISNYGATVTELHVPDRFGNLADVVLGFETLEQYLESSAYFGAIVGRVANRIRDGVFELDGRSYELGRNDGRNHLHGGFSGFDKAVWGAMPTRSLNGPILELVHVSRAGDQGYPGTLTAHVTYHLTNDAQLLVDIEATTDAPTLVNLAQHSYFNLAGHGSGSALGHELWLHSQEYTVSEGDPGISKPVEGTPFDFTRPKTIGRDLALLGEQSPGYDHNYVVPGAPAEMREVARVREPKSGRTLLVESDQPGLQLYCGSFLDGRDQGKGARYERYSGFCLETQKFPYAINVPTWRQQVILRPGATYRHRMAYRFAVDGGASGC